MRFCLHLLILTLLFSCNGNGPDRAITTASLLNEMIDLQRLAGLPDDNYRTVQFSSYDRRSTKRADSCWFSNEDGFGNEPIPGFEKVLNLPGSDGIGEYLICDVKQPGAIVRLWTAGLNGKIRLFLDNTDHPVYEGNAQDLFWKTAAMLSGKAGKPEYSDMFRQFDATYFPIPFSKRCRMEWIGDISKIHFYHVGLRIYDPGVNVKTFRIDDFEELAGKIEEVNTTLKNPDLSPLRDVPSIDIPVTEIADSSKKVIFNIGGPREMEYFSLRITSPDMENALRKSLLTISFDDASIPQVQAPVGDFFGSAPGLNPFHSLPFTVQEDGTMICRFVMPFKNSMRIEIENLSGGSINLSGTVKVAGMDWKDGKTMHFRARWRIDHRLTASTFEAGSNSVQDIIYLMASGKGRIVGAGAFLYNPSNATTSWGNWWGEGDEKIFVDADTFPSFFGTGTEDYFNYSWSSAKIFSYPYCGQPRNDGPGNRGYISNFRWHIADDIPFMDKIAFYMELGHHGIVPGFSYGRIVYYYALPDVLDDYRKISAEDIISLPYLKWDPVAYLGSAGFRYIQAERLIGAGPSVKTEQGKLWADGSIVMWMPQQKGEKIRFSLGNSSPADSITIGLTLAHTPDGGEISVMVNGRAARFDGNETINLSEPVQTILANHFSGKLALKKGDNEITIESVSGKTDKKIGIDFLWLKEF